MKIMTTYLAVARWVNKTLKWICWIEASFAPSLYGEIFFAFRVIGLARGGKAVSLQYIINGFSYRKCLLLMLVFLHPGPGKAKSPKLRRS